MKLDQPIDLINSNLKLNIKDKTVLIKFNKKYKEIQSPVQASIKKKNPRFD